MTKRFAIIPRVKKMRKDEVVKKNIGLTFDFIRAAVADPHLLDKIPEGAEIEFFETDLPV